MVIMYSSDLFKAEDRILEMELEILSSFSISSSFEINIFAVGMFKSQ